jgi:hypothetical protein
MSALDTLRDTQLSKVGKTEKTEPAVSRCKPPNQRSYENMRWHRVPAKGDRAERSAGGNRRDISFPVWLKKRSKKLKSI